ncbi:MAG: peptidyl-prolyl cis-trans isomerase [Bacteroidetes bacterium]|nr:peptidyl-prolyl cis-trans isomerase [Bacteroidota bacterium]
MIIVGITVPQKFKSFAFFKFSIVKIKNNPTPPLDSVKNEIAKVLGIRYSETSLKEFKDLQRKLVGEESVTWNAKGLAQIVQWSNSIPQFYKNVYKDTLQKAISSGDNFIIMESPQVKVDLKKYLYLLNEVLILSREVDFTESDIKSYILEAVKIDLIAQKARSLGLEKKILNPYTRNSALIDGIASLYDQYVIEKQIPPATEAALKIFYQENKDSLYYQLARVNIYVAFASDTAGISKFKDSLAHNVPFERIDKRVFVKRYIRTREGVIQPEKPEDNVVLGKIAFTLSLGDVAGPIEIIENGEKKLALFKCVYKIEEKQLLYEDVKDRIVNDYRQYYLNKIQESTFNQLKVKYSVQIYDDTFHQILTSLKIQ